MNPDIREANVRGVFEPSIIYVLIERARLVSGKPMHVDLYYTYIHIYFIGAFDLFVLSARCALLLTFTCSAISSTFPYLYIVISYVRTDILRVTFYVYTF